MKKKMLWNFLMILLIFSLLSVNMTGVTTAQEKHDIAVVSVTITAPPEAGELVNITVVVENNGTLNETFDVKVYYDQIAAAWLIETQTVPNLGAGANTSLTFTWNTTDVKEGDHTIIAVASEVEGETNIMDNTLTSTIRVGVSISPYIAVIPHSTVDTTLTLGKNYTVSIYTDYNGTDIWGYEFTLTYNPSVLQGVEVTNGDLITAATAPIMFNSKGFDNTLGELKLTGNGFSFLEPPPPLISGPGTLANVTFTVVDKGTSDITLGTKAIAPTRLIGRNATTGEEYNIIDDVTPDLGHILYGYFGESVTRDIAVISVTPSPTSVEAGELVNITVVVENNGTLNETFDVKVYYDQIAAAWLIETQTVPNLGAGANTSLTFTWNTTDVRQGDHTIIAVASEIYGEENTANNTLESDKKVTITLPTEPPLPIGLIIGILVVAVVVIVVVAYAAKRRKKPTPE